MKKMLLALLVIGSFVTLSNAEMKCEAGKCGAAMKSGEKPKKMVKSFQSVPADKATILQRGDAKSFCPACGMNLPMFYRTNHAATIDGKVKQYCSIHCLVSDIKKGLKLDDIKVVDTHSLKFIDAAKAFYVVGSSKKGTMSMVSKYAFASKVNANAFAKENGGKVVAFEDALKTAKSDAIKDNAMVSKKQAMMAKKGEMVYTKMCEKTDKKFDTVAQAKTFVISSKLCKELDDKRLQALGLFLKNR